MEYKNTLLHKTTSTVLMINSQVKEVSFFLYHLLMSIAQSISKWKLDNKQV
jgi:hypothetical protein